MRVVALLVIFLLCSCGSSRVVSESDITGQTQWLESSVDNPIINVIQRVYDNDDVEIVIKKKLTTDYVKLMLRNNKKVIQKSTIAN